MADINAPKDRIIACDLDGTLIRVNSYRHWLLFSCLVALISLRVGFVREVAYTFNARRKGQMSRWAVKQTLIRAAYMSSPIKWASVHVFQAYLRLYVRNIVLTRISELRKNGYEVYLNTAAWEVYCKNMAVYYGFKGVIATSTHAAVENMGQSKVDKLVEMGLKNGEIITFTDHSDDMPLARVSSMTYLVNPDRETLEIFENAGVKYSLLKDK